MTLTEAEPGRRGGLGSWIARDRVRAAAAALIVVSVLIRAEVASGGYLANDDFVLGSRSLREGLGEFLLEEWNNHVMPGGMMIIWAVTRALPLAYWPYLVLMLVGQVAVGIAFYRLLRTLLPSGWGLLVPLALLTLSPLSLEATSWWVVGVNHLPMQVAMALGISAQIRYGRTRQARHLVALGGSLVFGLLFFEKSLLITPLIFTFTACLLVRGGPWRSVVDAVRRYRGSWLVLGGISLSYLVLYLARATSVSNPAPTPGQLGGFVDQSLGSVIATGLVGGPWRWLDAGDGSPMADPPDLARWLCWAGLLLLVGLTVWRRRIAIRAWVVLALYVAVNVALLSFTRLGYAESVVVGLLPRYVTDVVPVAAVCLGVALFGLSGSVAATGADNGAPRPLARGRLRADLVPYATPVAVASVLLALFASSAWSAARFGDNWRVKDGRDYLTAVRAELARAPAGTVFFDAAVPERVIPGVFYPDNLQSRFLRQLHRRPTFVTAAEQPSIIDDAGRIRPVRVEGPTSKPGPAPCGYEAVNGQAVRIDLSTEAFIWQWAVRLAYRSDLAAPAELSFGTVRHRFDLRPGVHQLVFLMVAGGAALELRVLEPTARVCVSEITVGNPRPAS